MLCTSVCQSLFLFWFILSLGNLIHSHVFIYDQYGENFHISQSGYSTELQIHRSKHPSGISS